MANMASACALVMVSGDKNLFGSIRSWRARAAASTCILVSISAVCICIMVVCGVMLAREYSLARGFERTSCVVRNVTYSGPEQTCPYCAGYRDKSKDRGSGSTCSTSYFPCVRITVSYIVDWVAHEALLHPDSIQASGIYNKCSFNVCLKEKEDNSREVEKYAQQWRAMAKQQFECFYNTVDFDDVIVQKVYTLSDVVHSMFWPALVIVICCGIFLRLETRRRKLTFCGRQEDDDETVANTSISRKSTPEIPDVQQQTLMILRHGRSYGGVKCQLAGGVGDSGPKETRAWKCFASTGDIMSTNSYADTGSRAPASHEAKAHSLDLLTVQSSLNLDSPKKSSNSVHEIAQRTDCATKTGSHSDFLSTRSNGVTE